MAATRNQGQRRVKGIKVACWAQLLDKDRVTVGADDLLKTSRKHVARISPKSAAKLGLADAQTVTIAAELGSVELPLELTPEMAPDTVWLPQSYVYSSLQTTPGAVVTCTAGGMA
ncbi:MAG: hypothetical protein CSA63_01605 [Propionibacterium sp.]|nr:MAG: hypothetical protein CSA63_01605 [Propionibacterium sp.]